MRRCLAVTLVIGLLAACQPVTEPAAAPAAEPAALFDGERAFAQVEAQLALGPRYPGSEGSAALLVYLEGQLSALGWQLERQPFEYAGIPGTNLIARANLGHGQPVILAAHFDSRERADEDPSAPDQPVPGANDGASGVAVLLELARTLDLSGVDHEVWLVFFDHEDQGRLDNRDWIQGSTWFASTLTVDPVYVIVVDMIGDADQQVYYEFNSDAALSERLWAIAGDLGYADTIIPTYRHSMLDDHTPFLQQGIPAVLLIDFDYPYWHTLQDTPDKVSPQSLERIGRTLETFFEQDLGRYPEQTMAP